MSVGKCCSFWESEFQDEGISFALFWNVCDNSFIEFDTFPNSCLVCRDEKSPPGPWNREVRSASMSVSSMANVRYRVWELIVTCGCLRWWGRRFYRLGFICSSTCHAHLETFLGVWAMVMNGVQETPTLHVDHWLRQLGKRDTAYSTSNIIRPCARPYSHGELHRVSPEMYVMQFTPLYALPASQCLVQNYFNSRDIKVRCLQKAPMRMIIIVMKECLF